MKRVAAAVVLLLLAVSTAAATHFAFNSELTALSDSIEALIDCAEICSDDELKEKTDEVLAEWKHSSALLHSLVVHEGMDELEQNLTALPLIIAHSDRSEYKLKCIEAINQIENLINAEKLSFENIL